MQRDKASLLDEVEKRISDLQTGYVALQEQHKNSLHSSERQLDAIFLQLIAVLDMIESITSHNATQQSNNVVVKKVEKRLKQILLSLNVHEIVFTDSRIEPGKARVLEKRESSAEYPPNTVLEICRKGYQRGDKVIRPADIITAG